MRSGVVWTFCAICRPPAGGGALDRSGPLLVYAGGEAIPTRLLLDTSRYVASEPDPAAASLGLTVGPNPARGPVTVRYTLGAAATVRLRVVDVRGREVWAVDAARSAGAHADRLDTSGLAPGVYAVRLDTPGGGAVRRLVVAR